MPERPPRPLAEAETSRLGGGRVTPPTSENAASSGDAAAPAASGSGGAVVASIPRPSNALSSSGGSPAMVKNATSALGSLGSDANGGSASSGGAPVGSRPSGKPSSRPSGRPVNERVGEIVAERYRIERLLGEGGMGAVYEVEHTHMRKRFALKVLHADMSRLPEVVARFEREAMAAAHIDHANVAGATDFGKLPDGSFYLVLEYIEGRSLRRIIDKQAPLEQSRALHIVRQIALALDRAHSLGIVHRDLKPENVMLVERAGEPELVKVLDFGIAKVPLGELLKNAEVGAQPVLTQMGMVYGTPEYMAPEQALGQEVDARADLYALGVITYEMLAGVRPFEADSKVALLGMHVTAPIPTIAAKAPLHVRVSPSVEAMVKKLLAKEMIDRTPTSQALIEEIDAALRETGNLVANLSAGPTSEQMSGQMNRGAASDSAPPRSLGASEMAVAQVTSTQRFTPVQPMAPTQLPGGGERRPQPNGKLVALGLAAAGIALVIGAGTVFSLYSKKVRQTKDELGADAGELASTDSDAATTVGSATSATGSAVLTPPTGADAGVVVDAAGAPQHRAAADAAAAQHKWSVVVTETAAVLRADPAAVQDDSLLGLLRNAALDPKARESALGLAVTMGPRGGGLLYNVAYGVGPSYPWSSKRAATLLATEPMRHQVAPEVDVALSLRELQPARVCDSPTLYARAREVGDEKVLAVLQSLAAKKVACLRQDGALDQTIAAVSANAANKSAAAAKKHP